MPAPFQTDPRQRVDPRVKPQQPPPAAVQQSALPNRIPTGIPNDASDQEKAQLIMQVLQLSDEQIAMLPPEQRASILVLKEQIAKSTQRWTDIKCRRMNKNAQTLLDENAIVLFTVVLIFIVRELDGIRAIRCAAHFIGQYLCRTFIVHLNMTPRALLFSNCIIRAEYIGKDIE